MPDVARVEQAGYAGFNADTRESLEIGDARRSDPVEETLRQFGCSLLWLELGVAERIRPPECVLITLLIETPVALGDGTTKRGVSRFGSVRPACPADFFLRSMSVAVQLGLS